MRPGYAERAMNPGISACFSGVTDIVLDTSQAYRILRVMGDWRLYRYLIGSNKDLCAEFAGL